MKTFAIIIGLITCLSCAIAMSPLTHVPDAPKIAVAKAVTLADAYLAKTFPKGSSLYCQNATLKDESMMPVRGYRHWELVYRHAGAEIKQDPKSGLSIYGDVHVYVTMDGEVSHEL